MDDPRIERRSEHCLSFTALSQLARRQRHPTSSEAVHLQSCPRCASLRDHMQAAPGLSAQQLAELDASEHDPAGALDHGALSPRRVRWRRALLVASPLASAACLALALWLTARPQRPAADHISVRLHQEILQAPALIDPALRLLAETPRSLEDTERLRADNQALREQLQRLTAEVERWLSMARSAPAPADEGEAD